MDIILFSSQKPFDSGSITLTAGAQGEKFVISSQEPWSMGRGVAYRIF